MEIVGYIASILMGLSLGVVGGGGSILTVPILMYFFGQEVLVATTGSLFVVGTAALFGAVMSYRRGLVDIKTGASFALPGAVGILMTRKLILPSLPEVIFSFSGWELSKSALILFSFVFLMMYAARSMLRSGAPTAPRTSEPQRAEIAFKGFLVGGATAFVGAGGGFLIVPALVLLLKMPMGSAVGTSLAIVSINALFGFAISADDHALEWPVLMIVVLLSLLGLVVGRRIATGIPERSLKRGFAYFIIFIGSFIFIDQIIKL